MFFGSCAFFYYWSTHFNNNNIDTDQVMWRKHANNTSNFSVLNYYDFSLFEDIFFLFARTVYILCWCCYLSKHLIFNSHFKVDEVFNDRSFILFFYMCLCVLQRENGKKTSLQVWHKWNLSWCTKITPIMLTVDNNILFMTLADLLAILSFFLVMFAYHFTLGNRNVVT